jgi:hypothetical protein
MTYTDEDVGYLRDLVALWDQGGERVDLALRLSMLGWVRQASDAPVRFELTDPGRRILEDAKR